MNTHEAGPGGEATAGLGQLEEIHREPDRQRGEGDKAVSG